MVQNNRSTTVAPLLIVATLSLRAIAQPESACPRIRAPQTGINNQIAGPDAQPARCYFCGQNNKYKKDRVTINRNSGTNYLPRQTEDPTWLSLDFNTGYVNCHNRANANLLREAQETAEIRGWITWSEPGPHGGEDEWVFNVLLDIGWTATAPEVYAINTVERVAEFMSPPNIIAHGFNSTNPARPFQLPPPSLLPPPTGSSMLGGNINQWGGVNAAVVHVEVDGWGPSRGSCDSTVVNTCTAGSEPQYDRCDCSNWAYDAPGHFPVNWFPYPNDDSNHTTKVYWPFPVYDANGNWMFEVGHYVRIVGTLWKDYSHGVDINLPDDVQHAIRCWDSESTPRIGWQEMHGVDWMERIERDPNTPFHIVAGYAMCADTSQAWWAFGNTHASVHDTIQLGPKPPGFAYAVPAVKEVYWGPVINWSRMDSPYNDMTSSSNRIAIDATSVTINLGATANNDARALFNAFYDVTWSCNNPSCFGKCAGASDGCGGICSTDMCSPGYTCPGNVIGICCPPGTISCSAVCIDPTSNASNCGKCNNPCSGVANGYGVCVDSQCTISCNTGYCASGGQCVSTSDNYSNCGICGQSCEGRQSCINGVCRCSNGPKSCPTNYYWDDVACMCSQ